MDSKNKPNINVTIYTDGACNGNPGPGGWGAILIAGTREKEIQGGENETTNNRMEIRAAIHALNALKKPACVTLYTDSKYLKDGITKWIEKWKNNGWKTANKKPVKNQDLWQQLLDAMNPHQITWKWVKAHDGNPLNERVDKIAQNAAAQQINS